MASFPVFTELRSESSLTSAIETKPTTVFAAGRRSLALYLVSVGVSRRCSPGKYSIHVGAKIGIFSRGRILLSKLQEDGPAVPSRHWRAINVNAAVLYRGLCPNWGAYT